MAGVVLAMIAAGGGWYLLGTQPEQPQPFAAQPENATTEGGTTPVPASAADVVRERWVESEVVTPVAGAVESDPSAADIAAGAQDATSAEDLHFDCGRIQAGAPIEHQFVLRNDAAQPIRVLRTMPSMRCRMRFDRVIAVGAEGRFEVQLDTAKLGPGPFKLVIRVQTANRVGDRRLVLEGEIVAPTTPKR